MLSPAKATKSVESRRLLVARVAASRHINRSARLRDLLLYLTQRVLEHEAEEIHEQEVGHQVFGRPVDYETSSDNIVRVHASTLRKRLEQYFAWEGADEPVIIEIPKGNYAAHFRPRPEAEAPPSVEPLASATQPRPDRRLWVLGIVALFFAATTLLLLVRDAPPRPAATPTVALFWSQIVRPDRTTDVVLDDAAVALYQELTGRPVTLSNYFDRSYLQTLSETSEAAHLDPRTASSIVVRRQSSFAGANLLWKLMRTPAFDKNRVLLRFARDYSFRELKADNAILVGNGRSNPWVEPFESKLGLRWVFDKPARTYYPADSWSADKAYRAAAVGDSHEGYCAISLVSNLGQTGNVLVMAATGGSALNAGADFLADEQSLSALRRALPGMQGEVFPHFEALIKVKGRSSLPRDASIVLCRAPRK